MGGRFGNDTLYYRFPLGMPKAANGGWQALIPWTTAAALALLPAAPLHAADAARRARATQYFQQAAAMRQEVSSLPEHRQTAPVLEEVADAFRRVYYTSPHSSRADDSILAEAEILAQMTRRFGPAHRDRARPRWPSGLPGADLASQRSRVHAGDRG